MGIIIWLIVGGVVGWLAGLLMGDNFGIIGNIVVGIVGAFLGGLIFAHGDINTRRADGFDLCGIAARRGNPAGDRQSGAPGQGALVASGSLPSRDPRPIRSG